MTQVTPESALNYIRSTKREVRSGQKPLGKEKLSFDGKKPVVAVLDPDGGAVPPHQTDALAVQVLEKEKITFTDGKKSERKSSKEKRTTVIFPQEEKGEASLFTFDIDPQSHVITLLDKTHGTEITITHEGKTYYGVSGEKSQFLRRLRTPAEQEEARLNETAAVLSKTPKEQRKIMAKRQWDYTPLSELHLNNGDKISIRTTSETGTKTLTLQLQFEGLKLTTTLSQKIEAKPESRERKASEEWIVATKKDLIALDAYLEETGRTSETKPFRNRSITSHSLSTHMQKDAQYISEVISEISTSEKEALKEKILNNLSELRNTVTPIGGGSTNDAERRQYFEKLAQSDIDLQLLSNTLAEQSIRPFIIPQVHTVFSSEVASITWLKAMTLAVPDLRKITDALKLEIKNKDDLLRVALILRLGVHGQPQLVENLKNKIPPQPLSASDRDIEQRLQPAINTLVANQKNKPTSDILPPGP